jgi:hypothetical protein
MTAPKRHTNGSKLVLSEFCDQLIPISSEAWRHECEVAFLLGLPMDMQNRMLDGVADDPLDQGVDAVRGQGVAAMLRTEVERLGEIRRRRMMAARGPRPVLFHATRDKCQRPVI